MADPREIAPQLRPSPESPLQRAKRKAGQGEVVNFCPFGCDASQLDENGYCAHLIGFTTNRRTMERRVRRPEDGRIITSGEHVEKVRTGDQLVKITSTARVYRATPDPDLMPKDGESTNPAFLDPEEYELQQKLEELKNPVLDGVVTERTSYDSEKPKKTAKVTPP